jgi:hypothetical protein
MRIYKRELCLADVAHGEKQLGPMEERCSKNLFFA